MAPSSVDHYTPRGVEDALATDRQIILDPVSDHGSWNPAHCSRCSLAVIYTKARSRGARGFALPTSFS